MGKPEMGTTQHPESTQPQEIPTVADRLNTAEATLWQKLDHFQELEDAAHELQAAIVDPDQDVKALKSEWQETLQKKVDALKKEVQSSDLQKKIRELQKDQLQFIKENNLEDEPTPFVEEKLQALQSIVDGLNPEETGDYVSLEAWLREDRADAELHYKAPNEARLLVRDEEDVSICLTSRGRLPELTDEQWTHLSNRDEGSLPPLAVSQAWPKYLNNERTVYSAQMPAEDAEELGLQLIAEDAFWRRALQSSEGSTENPITESNTIASVFRDELARVSIDVDLDQLAVACNGLLRKGEAEGSVATKPGVRVAPENPWMDLITDDTHDDRHERYVANGNQESLVMVLTTDGNVILNREPAAAQGDREWLLPAGGGIKDGQTAIDAAFAEVSEEMGASSTSEHDLLGAVTHPRIRVEKDGDVQEYRSYISVLYGYDKDAAEAAQGGDEVKSVNQIELNIPQLLYLCKEGVSAEGQHEHLDDRLVAAVGLWYHKLLQADSLSSEKQTALNTFKSVLG